MQTELVLLYLKQPEDSSQVLEILEKHDKYDCDKLLEACQRLNLRKECSVLYGRRHQYKKALEILVYELGDYDYALQCCLKTDRFVRRQCFLCLFKIYINPLLRYSIEKVSSLLQC